MKKGKKLFGFFVLGVVALFALGACTPSEDDGNGATETPATENGGAETPGTDTAGGNGEVIEISALAWDPNFNIRALNIAADMFAEINPDITVEIIENAQQSIIEQLSIQFAAGTTVGLPNIVLIEDYRAQMFLQSFPEMFYDLSAYINPDDFAPYKIPMTSFEGRQYGVPFDTGVAGLFVRTDILEEAGFSVEDVTNIGWDRLIEIGHEVEAATGIRMMTFDPSDLAVVRMMIQSAGTWYTLEDGVTPHIADNEELALAFSMFGRLTEGNLTLPVTDWGGFVGGFNNGDVWAVPTGNWITASIMNADDQAGNWAVVPWPTLPGTQSVHATNLGGSSWYVLNIDGREAAAEFLAATFGSNVAFYDALLNEIGAVGTFIPAGDSELFQQEVEFFGGQQIFRDFSEWMQMIPEVNFGIHTYFIEDILVVAMQSYLNGQSVERVLQDAQAQADSQLN